MMGKGQRGGPGSAFGPQGMQQFNDIFTQEATRGYDDSIRDIQRYYENERRAQQGMPPQSQMPGAMADYMKMFGDQEQLRQDYNNKARDIQRYMEQDRRSQMAPQRQQRDDILRGLIE